MRHNCNAHGCRVTVPTRLFMCSHHWHYITPMLRRALNDNYTNGQNTEGNGIRATPEWYAAAKAAIDYLKVKTDAPVDLSRKEIHWGSAL